MEHYGLQTAAGHLTVPAESKEPYAADVEAGFRADAAQIIARYPQKRSALLPMLHLVQSVDGYITGRGIDLCAELLDLSTAEVSGVATFYTQYKRHPNGRYTVGVCTNTLCAVMGGDAIWEAVSEHLGIGHDETTDDGLITLERIECNAACDFAPVMMVNWEFFDNMTPESAKVLVDDLPPEERLRGRRHWLGKVAMGLGIDDKIGQLADVVQDAGDIGLIRRHAGHQLRQFLRNDGHRQRMLVEEGLAAAFAEQLVEAKLDDDLFQLVGADQRGGSEQVGGIRLRAQPP